LKHILKAPTLLAKRYYYGQIIKKFDQRADLAVDPEDCGLRDGFLKLPIDELLGQGLTKRLIGSDLRVSPSGDKRIYTSWNIPAFLWSAVLGSDRLSQIATRYLGSGARLDDIYVKTVSDGLTSVSEGWHTDQVGYRLKVFMVFDVDGDPAGTLVVPKPRPNLYELNVADEWARIMKRPKKEQRQAEMRVTYNAGDCLVFDTNLLHRGDYSSGVGTRYCIVAEYIDRDKADRIRGFAPCGPGQGRQQITIPAIDGIDPAQHPLIDGRLLKRQDEGYLYGYPK
jgi:hypothetical protein